MIYTNLTDFEKAMRDNFKGVRNKSYIAESISYHLGAGLITLTQATNLRKEYL